MTKIKGRFEASSSVEIHSTVSRGNFCEPCRGMFYHTYHSLTHRERRLDQQNQSMAYTAVGEKQSEVNQEKIIWCHNSLIRPSSLGPLPHQRPEDSRAVAWHSRES
ncbi:hypothetical protein RRG08_020101 [Elysia crispata]|uniref:Uncharacterized protein n=1 Tax=Elysia crispata TaxID=231223 RepID=A0AAE1A4R8_9GAST|nr:hypothetical protein RRG08_020101 [Elysia crispata]